MTLKGLNIEARREEKGSGQLHATTSTFNMSNPSTLMTT
jgi:hypothetical protein